LQHRVFDLQQQLASNSRLELSDAQINPLNGELTAGPGWLNSVHRDTATNPSGDALVAAIGASPAAPVPATPSKQLNGLYIRFQKSLRGNLLRRQLIFADRVRLSYAPVASWDAMLESEDPDVLGPDAIIAHCDDLVVAQPFVPLGNRRSATLEATGNVTVEGDSVNQQGERTHFTAQGSRLSYDEAKDLLILRGEGRQYARLSMQSQPGAERTEIPMREIQYSRKTKRLKADAVQSLQLNAIPAAGQPNRGDGKKPNR
jgi:hypothetical protein